MRCIPYVVVTISIIGAPVQRALPYYGRGSDWALLGNALQQRHGQFAEYFRKWQIPLALYFDRLLSEHVAPHPEAQLATKLERAALPDAFANAHEEPPRNRDRG